MKGENVMIPTFAFAAFSGTGKTTLVEKVVVCLKQSGLRVAVIKQDAHNIQIDKEGKDSWRFAKAGADMTIVSGPEKTAIIEHRERTLQDNLAAVHDVDVTLVEGYKNDGIPQIGICRKATGLPLPGDPARYAAIVTDDPEIQADCPMFDINDAKGVAEFIKKEAGLCG